MPSSKKILSITCALLVLLTYPGLADVRVYSKDGTKLEGEYIGVVDENAIAIDIGLGGPLILGNGETDYLEYFNGLGIRLACPAGWYMYAGNSLKKIFSSQSKAPMARWAVAFYKHPYGSIRDNPSIILEIQPKKIESSLRMVEMTIAHLREVTQNFKLIEPPHKITADGVEGIKYVVDYALSNDSTSQQTICLFLKDAFLAQIIATMGSADAASLKDIVEKSINSFAFTRGEWPKPSESNLYKVLQGGVVLYENDEVGYALILKKKKDLLGKLYVEATFPNPAFPQRPIIISKEISKDDKDLEFRLSSPPIKGIIAFKRYSITVNTYGSEDKKEIVDTLSQEIISFANTGN